MPGVLPAGVPVPADGCLPAGAAAGLAGRPFGFYVHVPFCRSRCGYCDFNTYTAAELGSGASRESYPDLAAAEVRLAARVLDGAAPPVSTVFFGGGTPTLLPPARLGGLLRVIGAEFGLAPDAEVTVEANPETVDERSLAALREAGITRISLGMQSAVPHVLAVLDREHQPGRPGPVRPVGPAGGLRARQPGPHLRHAGGERRRLEGVAGRGAGGGAGPHLGLRADRRGRHPAGRADQARRGGRPG